MLTDHKAQSTELLRLIQKITDQSGQHQVAIFCGAGISYNSGLPVAHNLIEAILSSLGLSESNASTIINSNLPFEAFIQTLWDEVNIDDILEIFSTGEPNTNHNLIAELAMKGFIKSILTTNFDLLIEKALINRGLKRGEDFEVYSSETEFTKIDWKIDKIRIIKIHGCVSNKIELGITMKAVASRTVSQSKNEVIKSFFSNKVNTDVIIVGYSCSDLFDISPQVESIEHDKSEIYLIEHVNKVSDFNVENISKKINKNPFHFFNGKRIYTNVDLFIAHLWKTILISEYKFLSSSIYWKSNISAWLAQALEYSKGINNQIVARMFYDVGQYDLAVSYWEKGIAIAQMEGNQIFFYSQLGNLGMAFNALGRYKEAKRCLEESVDSCQSLGNVQGEIAQLQALGNIYRNLREFDASIKALKRAISLAEKYELDGLCTSLGNIATVYNQMGQPEEAMKALQRGIAIAIAIGNMQSQGSMLCSLGISYFQTGDFKKAQQFIEKSLYVTRQIGDKQGECMAALNLSNIYLQFQDFDHCLEYATLALQIAQTIEIRQSEGGAYFNIGNSLFFKGSVSLAIPNLEKALAIYLEIYGTNHAHTIAASEALSRAKHYPGENKFTNLHLI